MVSILHISDTHAQPETLRRIDALVEQYSSCNILALTGDCTSSMLEKVPRLWNDYPQELKLAVPGNHDDEDVFSSLTDWIHKTPWTTTYHELLFVGINTESQTQNLRQNMSAIDRKSIKQCEGVVLLAHDWRQSIDDAVHHGLVKDIRHNKPILILHGHDHPREFSGSYWSVPDKGQDQLMYKSHVCSSVSRWRGLGHLIVWKDGTFSCEMVQVGR